MHVPFLLSLQSIGSHMYMQRERHPWRRRLRWQGFLLGECGSSAGGDLSLIAFLTVVFPIAVTAFFFIEPKGEE